MEEQNRSMFSRRRFLKTLAAAASAATLTPLIARPAKGHRHLEEAQAPQQQEETPAAGAPTATVLKAEAGMVEPTPVPRQAASGRATVIEVWYPYGGANAPLYEEYWKAFEDDHPDIGINAVYAANDLSTNAKLFTAIAGGKPPDVTWVDGPQVSEWGRPRRTRAVG